METLQDLFDFVGRTNAFLQIFGPGPFAHWNLEVAKLRKTLLETLGTRKKIWDLPPKTKLPPKARKECRKLVQLCAKQMSEWE